MNEEAIDPGDIRYSGGLIPPIPFRVLVVRGSTILVPSNKCRDEGPACDNNSHVAGE
jgi:hypothetical protein